MKLNCGRYNERYQSFIEKIYEHVNNQMFQKCYREIGKYTIRNEIKIHFSIGSKIHKTLSSLASKAI